MRRRDLCSRSGNRTVRAARRTGSVLVGNFRRGYPATALARLADPDPIDGLAVALAKLFGEHCRADVAFSGVRDYRRGVLKPWII
jgi:hypothetical protein